MSSGSPWWLKLPGFRTQTAWKKVVAIIGYALMILTTITTAAQSLISGAVFLVGAFGFVILSTDAWGLRRALPPWKSGNRLSQIATWTIFVSGALILFVVTMPEPPNRSEHAAGQASVGGKNPPTNLTLSDQIKAVISDSGGGFLSEQPSISPDKITDFSFDGDTLRITVNQGEWLGMFAGAELRTHLSDPLQTFRRLADEVPHVRKIIATLQSPAAEQRDPYGHVTNPGGMATFVILSIDCQDLKKFPKNFDWTLYPVYAANRYAMIINWHNRNAWESELREEIKLGGFQPEAIAPGDS